MHLPAAQRALGSPTVPLCLSPPPQNVPRYQTLVSGAEPVESRLRDALPEFLNAEIALRTVGDVSTAIAWLRTTYFHVRVRADPAAYAVPPPLRRDAASLERWMREALVLSAVRELAKQGLVRTDEDGFSLEPLQPGVIMAENYVRLPTMALVAGCPPGGGAAELLWVVARSAELSGIKLRSNEKKALNALNRGDGVRFHVMSAAKPDRVADRVATAADKIFLLVRDSGGQPDA
jgi:replicative superfamily II helicase